RNLEKGIGIFQLEIASRTEKQIFHSDVDAYEALHLHLHGTSPDNKYFLFSTKHSLESSLQDVTLASVATGEILGSVTIRGGTPNVAWLTTNTYCWID